MVEMKMCNVIIWYLHAGMTLKTLKAVCPDSNLLLQITLEVAAPTLGTAYARGHARERTVTSFICLSKMEGESGVLLTQLYDSWYFSNSSTCGL